MDYPNRVPAALSGLTVVNNRLYYPSAIGTPIGVATEQLATSNPEAGNVTISEGQDLVIIRSGSPTVTLPVVTARPYKPITIKSISSGTVTLDPPDSATIDGESSVSLLQYDSITLISDGSNWLIL